MRPMKPVTAVERSDNAKLGGCSATYVSQVSCPRSCPFRLNGCYAEDGHTGITTRRLNTAPTRRRVEIARLEADAIDRLSGERPLRLHVVGDSTTRAGTQLLAKASARYAARGGSRVWTYTHAWAAVPRSDWGGISVLASCERPAQVRTAQRLGYATAIVVAAFEQDSAYDLAPGVRLLPCPNQTRGVTCSDCGLCMDDARLKDAGLTIAFEAHGSRKAAVRQRIALPMA